MCMAHIGQGAISTSAIYCSTGNGTPSALQATSIDLFIGVQVAGTSAFTPATLIAHITISTGLLYMYHIEADTAGELTADIATTIAAETISTLLYTTLA